MVSTNLWIVVPIPITSLTFEIPKRNVAFDIVKEVRLEWGKASRSTKIIDKKSVIRGVRSTFKDTMKIG